MLLAPKLLALGCVPLLMLVAGIHRDWARRAAIPIGVAVAASAAIVNMVYWNDYGTVFGGWLRVDALSRLVDLVLLVAVGLVVLGLAGSRRGRPVRTDALALIFLSVTGAMALGSAPNLPAVFLGIELTAVPVFALVATSDSTKRSLEAGLKYFVVAVFGSALMLYGFSLMYGTAGTVELEQLARAQTSVLFLVGLALALAGIGLEIAVVPFHFWVPDTFEASSPQVAAYLAVVPKVAAMAVLVRLAGALGGRSIGLLAGLAVVAAVTMTFGNLAALAQSNVKRMLAYSGVAHAGYALVGIAAGTRFGLAAAAIYFALYGLAAIGAFLVVAATTQAGLGETTNDFAGLAERSRFLALAMALFMLSLTGVPLFAGFYGKLLVFTGAADAGLLWLAVVGLLNGVVSFGYYGRVLRRMYFEPARQARPVKVPASLGAAIGMATLGVVAIGVAPGAFAGFLRQLGL